MKLNWCVLTTLCLPINSQEMRPSIFKPSANRWPNVQHPEDRYLPHNLSCCHYRESIVIRATVWPESSSHLITKTHCLRNPSVSCSHTDALVSSKPLQPDDCRLQTAANGTISLAARSQSSVSKGIACARKWAVGTERELVPGCLSWWVTTALSNQPHVSWCYNGERKYSERQIRHESRLLGHWKQTSFPISRKFSGGESLGIVVDLFVSETVNKLELK